MIVEMSGVVQVCRPGRRVQVSERCAVRWPASHAQICCAPSSMRVFAAEGSKMCVSMSCHACSRDSCRPEELPPYQLPEPARRSPALA